MQGAGISREIVRWCRDGGVPFAGIVSSGRLAAMYEKWGAEFLVAEGAEAGGHIGDIGHPLPSLVDEVLAHTSLPVVAAGGVDAADVSRSSPPAPPASSWRPGSSPARTATCTRRSSRCTSARARRTSRIITSCVKGMKARAIRNDFTERLARGEAGRRARSSGTSGRTATRAAGACIECLGEGLCKGRASGFKESFCITDALLAAAVTGDTRNGLFYTGQSVVRIGERDVAELPSAAEILATLELRLAAEACLVAPAAGAAA